MKKQEKRTSEKVKGTIKPKKNLAYYCLKIKMFFKRGK